LRRRAGRRAIHCRMDDEAAPVGATGPMLPTIIRALAVRGCGCCAFLAAIATCPHADVGAPRLRVTADRDNDAIILYPRKPFVQELRFEQPRVRIMARSRLKNQRAPGLFSHIT